MSRVMLIYRRRENNKLTMASDSNPDLLRIQKLFDKIFEGDNPIETIQSVYELGELGQYEEARNVLISALTLPESEIKLTILEVFNQPDFWHIDLVKPVSRLLDDPDPEVRLAAVELLGSMKNNVAAPDLVSALKNPEEEAEIRYAIMAALANIGDKRAIPALESFMNSPHWEDRYNAIDAIGMIGDPKSEEILLKAIDDDDPRVRENAILSSGNFNTKKVQQAIVEHLNDNEIEVVAASIYMIGQFRLKKAAKKLIPFLYKRNSELQIVTCEALAKLKNPVVIPDLFNIICDSSPEVRVVIRETLDVFTNEQIMEPLLHAILNDEKTKYIQHRLEKFGEEGISLDRLRKLKVPEWAELLIRELLNLSKK